MILLKIILKLQQNYGVILNVKKKFFFFEGVKKKF